MIALLKGFAEEISLSFYNVVGNYMLTLCLMLTLVHLLTLPFRIKRVRRTNLLANYQAHRSSVLNETAQKYNGNPIIINRMRYEYDKLNKPKGSILSTVVTIIELLCVVTIVLLPFYPPSCITGEEAEIFGAKLFEVPSGKVDFSVIIVGSYLFSLVIGLFKKFFKAFNAQGKSKIFYLVMCLIEGLMTFMCVILSLKVLPLGTTLLYVVNTILTNIKDKLAKCFVKKRPSKQVEIQYKTVNLYQFEDLKEELQKEDLKTKENQNAERNEEGCDGGKH